VVEESVFILSSTIKNSYLKMRTHILLTGKPKSGKTTILKRIIQDLKSCGGFYTEEIVKDERRIGFKIKTIDGKEGILAKKDLKSRYRLGKYGINLEDLENIGVDAIEGALNNKEIVVIDEIGKMELFSRKFKDIVLKALDSDKRVIGVIHRQQLEFLNSIRRRKDVLVFEVNLDNHKELLNKISAIIGAL
jgi:nucleoside-triphosphatase